MRRSERALIPRASAWQPYLADPTFTCTVYW